MPQDSIDTPAPRPIRFVHRGAVVEVDGLPPSTTVLGWLREHARHTGTKEGCNEGDCGACTVLVGELDGGDLRLRPVNACIRYLPTLDGKALFTVEDLKAIGGGALHPAQQALVDCHGSQCGFCTPGFAMTLAATYERHAAAGTVPTRRQLADDLSGNLCRCTGYRPILDAGQRMFELSPCRLDRAPVVALLESLRGDPPLHLAAAVPAVAGLRRYHAPRSADELAALRAQRPDATLLAGGTDIGLWTNKAMRDLGDVIAIGDVAELRRIDVGDTSITIGAGASLEDAFAALAAAVPALTEVWLRFASPPVRHAGTLAGNLANGSPIGDGAPALMVLDARLHLRLGPRRRTLALDDFYLGYMKNRLEPGEWIEAIEVPRPDPAATVQVHKVSKRFDSDISALCAGFRLRLDGGRIADVRLAYGGMAAVVKRAAAAEAALAGQTWTEATVRAGMAALDQDFTPLTDHRASAGYRRQVARQLLWRLWHATRADAPRAAEALSVWEAR